MPSGALVTPKIIPITVTVTIPINMAALIFKAKRAPMMSTPKRARSTLGSEKVPKVIFVAGDSTIRFEL